jgi:hypothetical protein
MALSKTWKFVSSRKTTEHMICFNFDSLFLSLASGPFKETHLIISSPPTQGKEILQNVYTRQQEPWGPS